MINMSLRGSVFIRGDKIGFLEIGEKYWSVSTRELILKKLYMTEEQFNSKHIHEQFQWLIVYFKRLENYHN